MEGVEKSLNNIFSTILKTVCRVVGGFVLFSHLQHKKFISNILLYQNYKNPSYPTIFHTYPTIFHTYPTIFHTYPTIFDPNPT